MRVYFVLLLALAQSNAAPNNLIVGGDYAEENQFPYQISLRKYRIHFCGGSLIHEKYVLTAANCVKNITGNVEPLYLFEVLAGTNKQREGGQVRDIEKVIAHDKYLRYQYDIAVIKLVSPFQITDSIKPIDLFSGEIPPYDEVVISGWGQISENGPDSYKLKYNIVKSVEDYKCRFVSKEYFDGLICLGYFRDNGICYGDFGGPAVYKGKLAGVANYLLNSCGTFFPDYFAKVSYFKNWIENVISENEVL